MTLRPTVGGIPPMTVSRWGDGGRCDAEGGEAEESPCHKGAI